MGLDDVEYKFGSRSTLQLELTTVNSMSVIRTRPSCGTRQEASTGISRQGMRQLIIYLRVLKTWSRCISLRCLSLELRKTKTMLNTTANQSKENIQKDQWDCKVSLWLARRVKRGKMQVDLMAIGSSFASDWLRGGACFLAVLIESSFIRFFVLSFNSLLCVFRI